MRQAWNAFACILTDKYVFPAFEVALGLLFLYALGQDTRLFQRFRRRRGGLTADLSVIRGAESREQFHVAYGLLSVIVLQVVNAAETLKGYKTVLSLADIGIVVYLAYFNRWMRNKIIQGVVAWRNRAD
jgi:hypothetical protein